MKRTHEKDIDNVAVQQGASARSVELNHVPSSSLLQKPGSVIKRENITVGSLPQMETAQGPENRALYIRDQHELHAVEKWLRETVGLSQYYNNFVVNGYERMDYIQEIKEAEQLSEIGIMDKSQQERILSAIAESDNCQSVGDYIQVEGGEGHIDGGGETGEQAVSQTAGAEAAEYEYHDEDVAATTQM